MTLSGICWLAAQRTGRSRTNFIVPLKRSKPGSADWVFRRVRRLVLGLPRRGSEHAAVRLTVGKSLPPTQHIRAKYFCRGYPEFPTNLLQGLERGRSPVILQIVHHRFGHPQLPTELRIGTRPTLGTQECSQFPVQEANLHCRDAALEIVLSGGTFRLEKPVSRALLSPSCSMRKRHLLAGMD